MRMTITEEFTGMLVDQQDADRSHATVRSTDGTKSVLFTNANIKSALQSQLYYKNAQVTLTITYDTENKIGGGN